MVKPWRTRSSVSYTHLDVYKRQVLDQSAAFDGAWRDDALFPGIALEERRKTAEIIYESYVRFFETGDPNWEGIPEWKPLGDEREKMVWDGRIHTCLLYTSRCV